VLEVVEGNWGEMRRNIKNKNFASRLPPFTVKITISVRGGRLSSQEKIIFFLYVLEWECPDKIICKFSVNIPFFGDSKKTDNIHIL
jgi:hypothetical protein